MIPFVPAPGAPGSLAPTSPTLLPEAPHVLARVAAPGMPVLATECPSCRAGLTFNFRPAWRSMVLRFVGGCSCGAQFNVEIPLSAYRWAWRPLAVQ